MYVDMCLDMCIDMHVDMCIDMCVDTCINKTETTNLVGAVANRGKTRSTSSKCGVIESHKPAGFMRRSAG